jgi:hypothetical protein
MNGANNAALSSITTKAALYAIDGNNNLVNNSVVTYNLNLSAYDRADQNGALLQYMGNNKGDFGAIEYYNNGDNVTDFYVTIPVTIGYTWGEFESTITINIKRTAGH